ncbi:MAG: nicotinate-nucleotide adenylyltransferase [Pseudomonadota bacterium]|nr:nicotinate-nucleotide adenylyltransferase [Pseudomonadota bacterium]
MTDKSAASPRPLRIGFLGGTFDPVHFGHLRMAYEVRERLGLDRMHLVPCASPYHRGEPASPAPVRVGLLRAALEGQSALVCDERDLSRPGPTYSIDTLASLRDEFGDAPCLVMVLGQDAYRHLESWHRWQTLLDLGHLVVVQRPGSVQAPPPGLARWEQAHQAPSIEALLATNHGHVLHLEARLLEISSTDIRAQVAAGRSPRYLLPAAVEQRILELGLYTPNPPEAPRRSHEQ